MAVDRPFAPLRQVASRYLYALPFLRCNEQTDTRLLKTRDKASVVK